jgi:hypothetical protein
MGGPEADREDLIQDVFVVVRRRLPYFDRLMARPKAV